MKVLIRPIEPKDNPQVARIIRSVMPEFGAGGMGFAIHDTAVDNMYDEYRKPHSIYFVCEVNRKVIGGGGIAPLQGGDAETCELQKMYFLAEGRGRGYGKLILTHCLNTALELGFKSCYIETFSTMRDAMKLYEKNGFKKIPGALGNTGHFACDTFYLMELTTGFHGPKKH